MAVGLRRIMISHDLLRHMLGQGTHATGSYVIDNGIPGDGRIVSGEYDKETGLMTLTVASANWDGPPDGGVIQWITPSISLIEGARDR